jgi:hypothetical protein
MTNEGATTIYLFIIKVTDGSLKKGEILMNRTRRFLIALVLGLLLATQIAPAGAAIPMRCGLDCATVGRMAEPLPSLTGK